MRVLVLDRSDGRAVPAHPLASGTEGTVVDIGSKISLGAVSNVKNRRGSGAPTESIVERKAAAGAAWMGLQAAVIQALSFGVFVVLGRLLRPSAFGIVAAASVVIWLLRVLVDQGFSQSLIQKREISSRQVDTAFWTGLITGVAIAMVTAATAPLIAQVYGEPALTNILRALSVVFIFVGLDGTQSALLARSMQFRVQSVRRMVASLASAAVAVIVALIGGGVWALVAQILVFEGLSVLLLWRMADWRPSLQFSRADFRELFGFGVRMTGVRTLVSLSENADNFLIGVVLGPLALAYYVIAFRILIVVNQMIALSLNQVVLSTFSRLQHDRRTLNQAFHRSATLTSALAFPIYAGLALLAHPAIVLVFGANWAPSVGVMRALALVGWIQCQTIFTTQYVVASGRVGNELIWTACVVALELVGFAIGVQFGIVAVALSLAIVLMLAFPVRLWQLSRWGGIRVGAFFSSYPILLLATAALVVAILGVDSILSHSSGWGGLLAAATAGFVAYVIVLLVGAREVRDLVGSVLHCDRFADALATSSRRTRYGLPVPRVIGRRGE